MKAALLVCDHIRDELVHIDGEYPDMFAELLPDIELHPYWVCDNEFPASANDHDLYICTGSKHSVYEDIPWIHQLNDFVNDINASGKKYLGLCFGHQMMGQALGGKVKKAEGGWSVGVHEFELEKPADWTVPLKNNIKLLLMCQDQVSQLPDGSVVHASSKQCPVGIFSCGSNFLGIQAHPEFSKQYHQALFTGRSEQIGDDVIAQALGTMDQPVNRKEIVQWMMNFLVD